MDIIEEYINKIEKPIESIKGVGSKKSALFAKLGIHTIGELVHFFPRSYDAAKYTLFRMRQMMRHAVLEQPLSGMLLKGM